ncbi:MAG TPA: NRDE family protein [Gemmatimonadales bacterium]|nr:NRDE family protein [Gemmatimonadales bacterium]
MCTASWSPGPDGYTFCFNRDERRTRAPALEPAERVADSVRFLAPLDGDFGGTWIAVTEHGLAFGLLNRYQDLQATEPHEPLSRGLLIPVLASSPDLLTVATRLEQVHTARFRPFTLIALAPGHAAVLAAWDGRQLRLQRHVTPGLLLTSSAVNEPEVAAARVQTFAALPEITGASLGTAHRSHLPEKGPRSVCMHRPEAQTRSYSRVVVTPTLVALHHTEGPPCERTVPLSLQLARANPMLATR